MNNALAHRGPDDAGTFMYNNLTLGHRRLSIIDLSSAGNQPMSYDKDRYTIVYNGEIYNFRDIRKELCEADRALSFQTGSDTEVILAAYAIWGSHCLQKFNGMFAFAIFDKLNNKVFMARDRLGIKPFYYFKNESAFVFSSEMRALLKSDLVPGKLDAQSLVDYLRYQTVHAPDTILKGVKMLLPGHYAELNTQSLNFNVYCYWEITSKGKESNSGINYSETCGQVKTLFMNSVKRRLVADVPFGAFLSGGIDSSVIVGAMTKIASGSVKTFSITFHEKQYNEEQYSKLIAEKFQTDHHNIKLSVHDFKREIPEALKAMDHPSGDGPNTYVVSKYTKQAGITMALSGLGGDELFAGYDIFRQADVLLKNQVLKYTPFFLKNIASILLMNTKPTVAKDKVALVLRQYKLSLENIYPVSRQVLLDNQISKMIIQDSFSENQDPLSGSKVLLPENQVHRIAQKILSGMLLNHKTLSAVSMLEISTYMQNVLLRDTDQMSMANALEVRVPFLDHELVEFVLSQKDEKKYPFTPKKLLVDSLAGLLPEEVVNRKKMGFSFPWQQWLRTDLKQFCEERIHSLARRPIFHENEVLQLWKRFLDNDRRITWSRIWHLVVLENWMIENKIES